GFILGTTLSAQNKGWADLTKSLLGISNVYDGTKIKVNALDDGLKDKLATMGIVIKDGWTYRDLMNEIKDREGELAGAVKDAEKALQEHRENALRPNI